MVGHGAKFGRKKQEAIEALLRESGVEEAARSIDIAPSTLSRWMDDPEFDAALRAARRAEADQSTAMMVQTVPLTIKLHALVMYQSKKPSMRLKACCNMKRLSRELAEIDEFAAQVAEAERSMEAARVANLPAAERGKKRRTGHGAKLPGKMEQAIAALLTQTSVAEAARKIGISIQTLRRWMEKPEFAGRFAAATCKVFGPAVREAHRRSLDAAKIIRQLSCDLEAPEETRERAILYIAAELKARKQSEVDGRLAALQPGEAGESEPVITRKTGRSLFVKLKAIKAFCSDEGNRNVSRRMVFVHALDGRPAGTSIGEPDGRHTWLEPPEGCEKGSFVEKDQNVGEEANV